MCKPHKGKCAKRLKLKEFNNIVAGFSGYNLH